MISRLILLLVKSLQKVDERSPPHPILIPPSPPHPVPFVVGLHPFGTRQESLPQNMMWEVFKDRRWQKSAAVAKSAGISTKQAVTLRRMWSDQIDVIKTCEFGQKIAIRLNKYKVEVGINNLKNNSQYVAMLQTKKSIFQQEKYILFASVALWLDSDWWCCYFKLNQLVTWWYSKLFSGQKRIHFPSFFPSLYKLLFSI